MNNIDRYMINYFYSENVFLIAALFLIKLINMSNVIKKSFGDLLIEATKIQNTGSMIL